MTGRPGPGAPARPGRGARTARHRRLPAASVSEPRPAALAQGAGPLSHVLAHEAQHLVGDAGVERWRRDPQPVVERPLGPTRRLTGADGDPLGDLERVIQNALVGHASADQAYP